MSPDKCYLCPPAKQHLARNACPANNPVLRLMAEIWGEPTTPEIYEFAIKPA